MLNPFINLISQVLGLYLYCVIAWAVLDTLISFKVINAYQPIVRKISMILDRLCEPVMRPIRKYMPDLGGLDLSPIVVILLINFIQSALYQYLYNL